MKINTAYGLALIVGTVAAIVTMAFHPTGFDPHASVETVAHDMSVLVAVHSLALLSVPLLVFGFAGLTMRAGWHRPEAILAFIILKAVLSYNFQFNQACAKVFVVGTSLAMILWSITLFRFGVLERRIGIIGWFISLTALFGLLSGHVHMSAHGFGLIVLLQGLWAIALGVSMLRANRDVAVVTGDAVRG